MLASDVLLLTRSLLRDDEYEELRFSDRELLDSLSHIQNDLITLFRENIKSISLEPKSAYFKLGFTIGYVFSLRLNGREIALKSAQMTERAPTLLHLGDDSYMLVNHSLQKGDVLELSACALAPQVESPSDKLALDDSYRKALSLGIVCDMLLREPSELNMQRMEFYTHAYEKEKGNICIRKNASHTKRVFYTRAQN